MKMITKAVGWLIHSLTFIGALAVILMMLHVTLDVAGKYLFNSPIPGTVAIVSQYYMVAVCFLPLALAERDNAHITVEVLADMLPRRTQNQFGVAWTLLSLILFSLLTWRNWIEAGLKRDLAAFVIEQDYRIPVWPSYYLLPIGTGAMCLVLIHKLVRVVRSRGTQPTTEKF